ncbi:MAG: sigma-70 family RNA polymerase sigma factor [Lachnospiraceae bacterium]|nr:sigma-70 family RNA polymerase sigma factor [Lachnospiraceae bacterium]
MSKCSESRLSELIDLYEKLVFSICYKITGDYFIAEDLTQETFLSVFQKYDTFDGGNEKAWICRIATNKSIDYVRSAGHKGVPTEDDFFEGITEKRGSPEELCMEEEIKRGLKVSCESLKPPYDEIAKDYYLKEMSAVQIAKKRNANLKTIQTQIYRARDMLRKIYGREGTA